MRELALVCILLAVGTTAWTWWPRTAAESAVDDRAGTLLTRGGETVKPENIALLHVESWDSDAKAPKLFEVAKKAGKWIIPSHYDYPADAGTRVGETAGGVLNVPRGPLVSNSPEQFAEFGVADPLKEGLREDARGRRITLKDEGGAVLVDLIVGKETSQSGVRYVREAGSDEVYTAKLNVDISTRFKDWVETDFLKLNRYDVREIGIKDYSIDETKRTIKEVVKMRSETVFQKPQGVDQWTSPNTPDEKVVDQDTIGAMLTELTGLRLVDVQPFEQQLLMKRGFYPIQQEDAVQLYGNEGHIEVSLKDGQRYFLFFGEISVESDEPGKAEGKEEGNEKETSHNRYMAAFAQYDPAIDEDAKDKAEKTEAKTGESEKEPQEKTPEGEKKAEQAQLRFQKFFYVIDDASFKKLRPDAAKLFKNKELKKEDLVGEKVPESAVLEKKDGGLQWAELKEGEGEEAAEGDEVEVLYTGMLQQDGSTFDSSAAHGNEPFKFTIGLGPVIKGWDQGVPGMKVGGKRKLVIPPELGYGDAGSGEKIPGKATLVFDIELLKVKKKDAPPPAPPEEQKTSEAKTVEAKTEEAKTAEE
ncbi:MAG: FKBP-type peptidyl-prolyl cis-trans isomerase [Planctomycetota bacterium]|nr:FKBP-type peptidyl-prolyl cis-trans isomerase [Planctomycetota bacterium]